MQDSFSQSGGAAAAPSIRVRTFLKGIVYYDNRRLSIECTVRDLSDSGARISLNSIVTLPDNVELFITQKERTYKAHVRRRDGYEIGVSFEDQRSGEPRRSDDMALADRVVMLEQELAAMRKVVRKLRDKIFPNESDAI